VRLVPSHQAINIPSKMCVLATLKAVGEGAMVGFPLPCGKFTAPTVINMLFFVARSGAAVKSHRVHYDNAAARLIEVVSDEAENRRGPLCNIICR